MANEKQLSQVVSELSAIKKLLMLLLQKQDVKVAEIARVLGVTSGRVSQMISMSKNSKKGEKQNG